MAKSGTRSSVLTYADDLRRWVWPPGEIPVSAVDTSPVVDPGPTKRLIRKVVPEALLPVAQTLCTRVVMPYTGRRLVRRSASSDLRVHFACGSRAIPGWINIDLLGSSADFFWDLRRPVPLPDSSVATVYHEHFLEHLPFQAALGSLREAHRLLEPGGTLRFGVPDFARYCRAYVDDDEFLERCKPERPTACLAINEILYWYGHRSMWDEETLITVLTELGLVDVRRRRFGDSGIDPCPDWEHHEIDTLYIEGLKPRACTPSAAPASHQKGSAAPTLGP